MSRVVSFLFFAIAAFGWFSVAKFAMAAGLLWATALACVAAVWMGGCAWEALKG